MKQTISESAVNAAIAAIESESATLTEKVEMLIEMAAGLQAKPKSRQQLDDAISLYEKAIALCDGDYPLLRARSLAGMGTAFRTIPSESADLLLKAKDAYETALPILQEHAAPEEIAEAEMNWGLVVQALVPFNLGKLQEAVKAYQRALRVFTGENYPQEYAILQNNMAIAHVSLSRDPEKAEMWQALAVQSLEDALKWVNLIDYPSEYAMLQNNLGNILQYLPSNHAVDNNLRALAAYNESLKVRTAKDTPVEYANTIANKANLLYNLPDDPHYPEKGNPQNLLAAKALYREAREVFTTSGELERAAIVSEALQAVEMELLAAN